MEENTTLVMTQQCDDSCTYRRGLLKRLLESSADGTLCDVDIITSNGQNFPAHRGVLAAASDYFKALFTADMVEKSSRTVNLDVEPSIMNDLLKFIYTGEVILSEGNANELFLAADYLVIHQLKEKAATYLETTLSFGSCFRIRDLAERCGCLRLKNTAQSFIEKNFVALSRSGGFNQVSRDQMLRLISSDNIIVDKEEDVHKALLTWISADLQNREKFYPEFFSRIRLFSMSKEYIRTHILGEQRSGDSLGSRLSSVDITTQALKVLAFEDQLDSALLPRRCLRKEATALVLTGGRSAGRVLARTLAYVPEHNTWVQLKEMSHEREEHAVVVCQRFLYVIGGMRRPRSVDRYDPRTNTWCTAADLIESAIAAAAVCLDNKIFVLGGKDGFNAIAAVQVYDPVTNQWTLLPPLNVKRKALCAAVLHGEIYAIGGCTNDNDSLDVVQKLNPGERDATWRHVSPLRQHRKYACAENLSTNKIVVLGGYHDNSPSALRSCEVYSAESAEWQYMRGLIVARAAAGIARVCHKLFVIGGRSDRRDVHSMEWYDIDEDQWEEGAAALPGACAWSQCGVLSVPSHYLRAQQI